MSRRLNLFASIFLPLSLAQWTPTPIGSQKLPEVTVTSDGWHVKTAGNAGGWAYLFPNTSGAPSRLSWSWQVAKFPAAHPSFPLDKRNDDYALRVGVLFSDGRTDMPLPQVFRNQLRERNEHLSAVIFYCVSNTVDTRQCGVSPYNDQIFNCLIPADRDQRRVEVSPQEDAKKLLGSKYGHLDWIGTWVFFDSDNSKSVSDARLSALKLFSE